MTWTKVNSATANGYISGNNVALGTTTIGNLVVVEFGSSDTGMTVSDSLGLESWHQIVEQADDQNDQVISLWYTIVAVGGSMNVRGNTSGAFNNVKTNEGYAASR